jgi:bifunctional UDP-N-acetylglucosamine pyrophosphorylase/glucosamine-1-phosphate N-acetyltransferase
MNDGLACIILAAGKGKRMKSARPKVMHELAGRPMINWLLESVEKVGAGRIIVVAGPDMEDLKEAVSPHTCVVQDQPLGTADAVKAGMAPLEGFTGKVLILMGDEPLVPRHALSNLVNTHAPLAVMGIIPDDPRGLGRLLTDDNGHLLKIIEEKETGEEEREIMLCNGGNYCADAAMLRTCLPRIKNDNSQGEYYLTDIVTIAGEEGINCEVMELAVDHVWGINTRAQLAEHEAVIQRCLREIHMEQGVTLTDPETVYFSWDTKLGRDVTIGPNVFFGPGVTAGDSVTILPFSHLEGVKISKNVTIGPFARLRPETVLEEDVKVGNFVEVKKTHLKKGTKVNHLTYIGDAEVGSKCNIGAGTVFCNYDGINKHKTVLKDQVFVGSNSTLVAPVQINKGAYVGAGSVITKDVPEDSLAVARRRQIILNDWAKQKREKDN